MKNQDESLLNKQPHLNTQERVEEQGETAEPDAPTAEEENEGMSTVLGTEPVTGVQNNASEE